jgi:hypothetical protein
MDFEAGRREKGEVDRERGGREKKSGGGSGFGGRFVFVRKDIACLCPC